MANERLSPSAIETKPGTPSLRIPEERGRLIDGDAIAASIREDLVDRVGGLGARGITPRLDAILTAAENTPAALYAMRQQETCAKIGIAYTLHRLSPEAAQSEIVGTIESLNRDPNTHGIMIHMPLPPDVDVMAVKSAICPSKDVEGVTPANIGNVLYGRSTLAPCTGLATVELAERTGMELRGKRIVVIGASDTVGKPIAALLMRRDATVISCNIFTWGLEDLARSADVLITAAGKPNLVGAEMVKPGAVVIDVGMNRVRCDDGKVRTVGDVSFDLVRPIAGWISPVPGGVGPVTVAMLLRNVIDVAESANT